MEKRTFNFSKGLGIFFALAAGIGAAILGYIDRTDWIQVVFYSFAVVALVLWGWHHFSINWSYGLSFKKTNKEEPAIETEEDKSSLFFEIISKNWIAVLGLLLLLAVFILLCFLKRITNFACVAVNNITRILNLILCCL